MKQRIISALLAIMIVIPIIIIGGYTYKVGVLAIAVISFFELLRAKEKIRKIPVLMKIIAVSNFVLIATSGLLENQVNIVFEVKYLLGLITTLLIPLILYHRNKEYNFEDASFLILSILMLGISFNMLMMLREYNINYFILIILLPILCDTFAYFTGMLIGKHKLCEEISPKKTTEGVFGGITISTIVISMLYVTLFDYTGSIFLLVMCVFFLSIICVLGDLIFSFIKREFKIKDFGNVMPGHGGILDRLDSLLCVLLVFYLLLLLIM